MRSGLIVARAVPMDTKGYLLSPLNSSFPITSKIFTQRRGRRLVRATAHDVYHQNTTGEAARRPDNQQEPVAEGFLEGSKLSKAIRFARNLDCGCFWSEYDRGVNTFSPEGRLFQVEYALGAIKLGSTAIGIQTKDGVVLASERRITSCLLEPQSIQKIAEVDTHIACAMSGLIADARTLIDHARVECANHFFTYNEKMSIRSCVDAVADLALDFSDVGSGRRKKTMSRPFGVALLVAGVDKDGPALYCADPSGTVTKYLAVAMGSAQEGAESMLQEQYHQSMSLEAAEDLALVVLRQVMEEKLNCNNVEMAAIRVGDTKFKQYTADDLKAIIARLPAPTIPTATDISGTAQA